MWACESRPSNLPVDDEGATTANVVDGVFQNLDGTGSLDNCKLCQRHESKTGGPRCVPMSKP